LSWELFRRGDVVGAKEEELTLDERGGAGTRQLRGCCWLGQLSLLLLVLLLLLGGADHAQGQSLGLGFGLGVPLMTYVEGSADKEFRVYPEPGYYPILTELHNAAGSTHFNLDLVLNSPFLVIFDEMEFRFSFATFGWSEMRTTHSACAPSQVSNGVFDDATARYFPVDEAWCLQQEGAEKRSTSVDVSELELPSLTLITAGFGGRHVFLEKAGWKLFSGLSLGLAVSTFSDPSADFYFGGQVAASAGVSYALSRVASVEVLSRASFLVTEAPAGLQQRLNHETQTGGHIFSTLFQTFAYVDFHFGLRFSLADL